MTRSLLLIFSVLFAHLVLLINTRFTLWPEMVVYPYLVNNGFLLYKDIINPYPPTLTFFLSLFSKLFGYQPIPYQIMTWFMILITDVIIFKIAKNFYKKNLYAVVSTAFFVFVSIPFSVNGLWFDLLQTPLILLSFFAFQKFLNGKNSKVLFLLGALLTLTFFVKQQVVWFGLYIVLSLYWKFREKTISILHKNSYVALPFLIVLTLCTLYFWRIHALDDFLYWVFYFPFIKASRLPGYILLPSLKQAAAIASLFLTFAPIIFIGSRQSKLALFGSLALLLFAYPRFDYFHLIPALSLVSLTAGENISLLKKTALPIKTISLLGTLALLVFCVRYLSNNWTREVRFFEKDILNTSVKIREVTKNEKLVFIQNGPDQLLPLSTKLPPKPWVDDFPWYLETGNTQDKVLEGLMQQNPRYVIYKPYDAGGKFGLGSYRPSKIANYLEKNYQNTIQISDTLWLKEKI